MRSDFYLGQECIYKPNHYDCKLRVVLTEQHGDSMWTIEVLSVLEGEPPRRDSASSRYAWWNELSELAVDQPIGGSGAVAQVTPPALAQPEPTRSQVSTPAIDALWTDGDVRQWASEQNHNVERPIEWLRIDLRCWLNRKPVAAPRAPVHRPVNLNAAREILEPRIFK